MRETIVEEEITEKEVERVYCDECGDECTDNHRIEPQEVCKGCSSEDSFSTLERFESATLDANEQTYSLDVNIMAERRGRSQSSEWCCSSDQIAKHLNE